MSKKLMFLALALVVIGPVTIGRTAGLGPVGWWKFDETTGATAADSSVNKNDGSLLGGPVWTPGQIEGGLRFDGTDDYVALPIGAIISTLTDSTFSVWANYTQQGGAWQRLFDIGTGQTVNMFLTPAIGGANDGVMRFAMTIGGSGAESQLSAPARLATGWHHIAVVIDAGEMDMQLYLDGVSVATAATARVPKDLGNTNQNWLGRSEYAADAYYSGSLDDFRIYDRALAPEEVVEVMGGGLTGMTAGAPNPVSRATDVPRETSFSWMPGELAATHDLYLGASADEVRNATRTNPPGVLVSQGQDANSYDPPGRLELGQTYYWRVDEVGAAPDLTVFKGNVWSFTVEPYSYPVTGVTATASSVGKADMGPEKTVDRSGLSPDDLHSNTSADMWLSDKSPGQPAWIQFELPAVEKLDKMLVWNSNQALEFILGLGSKDVKVEYSTDGTAWTTLGDFVFPQAMGLPAYASDITVDFGGVAARFVKLTISSNFSGLLPQYSLSEVRFYSVPVAAREPQPAPGAAAVNPQVRLSWRAGREADSHKVVISDDQQAVIDGTASAVTVSAPEHEASLLMSKTYYWKVIEVNEAEAVGAWDSEIWSFATNDFVAVDDCEAYTDDEGGRIYESWLDGWDDPANGSVVGYSLAPFAEQTIVHGGKQSMPLACENTGTAAYSEAKRTFEDPQDWTRHGVTTLVVYFRGQAGNSPARLYLKINDTKVSFNNGANVTAMPLWRQWNIPLADTGASLQSVKSLTIGVEGSGTGTVFVDDIRLYGVAPEIVSPADPGTNGLVALYAMEGNAQDTSGKNNHGTISGETSYTAGYAGQAMTFNGTSTYVDLPIGTLMTSLSDATIATHVYFNGAAGTWQRIFDFGTGTANYMFLTPRLDAAGPMRFAIRTATVTEQAVEAPAAMSVGWHHAAVVIDSKTMTLTLYLDGEQVGTAATTLLPKDLGNTTQNWLGRSQWAADAYFGGQLDEFRIYNRALSAAEVRYLAGDR